MGVPAALPAGVGRPATPGVGSCDSGSGSGNAQSAPVPERGDSAGRFSDCRRMLSQVWSQGAWKRRLQAAASGGLDGEGAAVAVERRYGHARALRMARWSVALVSFGSVAASVVPWAAMDGGSGEDRVFDSVTGTLALAALTYLVAQVFSCWWLESKTIAVARRYMLAAWFTGVLFVIYAHVKCCMKDGRRVYCHEMWHREATRWVVATLRDYCMLYLMVYTLDLCRGVLDVLEKAFRTPLRAKCIKFTIRSEYALLGVGLAIAVVWMCGLVHKLTIMWFWGCMALLSCAAEIVVAVLVSVSFRKAYYLALEEMRQTEKTDHQLALAEQAVIMARKLYIFTPGLVFFLLLATAATLYDMPHEPGPGDSHPESSSHAANLTMLVVAGRYVVMLSGIPRISSSYLRDLRTARLEKEDLSMAAAEAWTTGDAAWDEKVRDLAGRGVSVRGILAFYRRLATKELMPHYRADTHTTRDVVRHAIIPEALNSRYKNCALATVLMRGPAVPHHMVTHTWSNNFSHLVAAVVAHALGAPTYEQILPRLRREELSALESELFWKGRLDETYWICAFSVDQHASICDAAFPGHVDTLTREPYPSCNCGMPKHHSDTPPVRADGQSIACEMNKFDDMMHYLSVLRPQFSQVIAVDNAFNLFERAWCVAEFYVSHTLGMEQHMIVISRSSVEQHEEALRQIRVENMSSSNPADKNLILSKIQDKDVFNADLVRMIFDEKGLLQSWKDGFEVVTFLADVARRSYSRLEEFEESV